MKQKLSSTDKAVFLIDKLESATSAEQKRQLATDFYLDAAKFGAQDAEEDFKSESRGYISKIITNWFFMVNILTAIFITTIFVYEWYIGRLGSGLITTNVLIALIGATVAQNAAAFILFAKYTFNVDGKKIK